MHTKLPAYANGNFDPDPDDTDVSKTNVALISDASLTVDPAVARLCVGRSLTYGSLSRFLFSKSATACSIGKYGISSDDYRHIQIPTHLIVGFMKHLYFAFR